jgi:SPX domain protein involved in polyphosphate accumulation
MKFAKYQQNNLVPEWRKKYLDVSNFLRRLTAVQTRKKALERGSAEQGPTGYST